MLNKLLLIFVFIIVIAIILFNTLDLKTNILILCGILIVLVINSLINKHEFFENSDIKLKKIELLLNLIKKNKGESENQRQTYPTLKI